MTYDYSATILLEKLRLLATTISAGTLRLLLTSISYRAKARKELRRKPPMVPRRPPRLPTAGLTRRVEGARSQAAGRGKYRDPRRAGMVCDMLHRLAWIHNRGAPLYTLL